MSVLPFRNVGRDNPVKIENRDDTPKTRSVVFPAWLWEIIDKDARRCRRSTTKHLEALLAVAYGFESSVDFDEETLALAQYAVSKAKIKIKKTA
jgi:hypothetical protein